MSGCAPDQIGVRLDSAGQERLEWAVGILQGTNPELSVDDCIDAIFHFGLAVTTSSLSMIGVLSAARH